jgi:S1-C subfamily serine protease
MSKRNRASTLVCLLAISIPVIGAVVGCSNTTQNEAKPGGTITNPSLPMKVDPQALSDPGAIADAAARVEPSVVTINTEYRPRAIYSDDVLGLSEERIVQPRGTGSGVILSADGIIVTNNHVVENATKIQVTLEDGRELEGTVIGSDPPSDLAVVRVNEKNLPAVTLGDSDQIRVGEWVEAIGNPLGVGTTVTAGIVSAIRKKGAPLGGKVPLTAAIQTDAAINPGNSGGALADIKGRLIGINTAILSTSGGNIGIGFAIPVNTVREVTAQLIEKGRVVRPWLGVSFGPITPRARAALSLPSDLKGVVVGSVVADSPAAEAGLQPGDVLQKANETEITDPDTLRTLVQNSKIGDTIRLTIWRDGSASSMSVTLREQPDLSAEP